MGELSSIVYKPHDAAGTADGYTRLPLREAGLVVGKGMGGGAKGRGSHGRPGNMMTRETGWGGGGEARRASQAGPVGGRNSGRTRCVA